MEGGGSEGKISFRDFERIFFKFQSDFILRLFKNDHEVMNFKYLQRSIVAFRITELCFSQSVQYASITVFWAQCLPVVLV